MDETSNPAVAPISPAELLSSSLRDVRQRTRRRYQEFENQIRKSPTTSLLGAVAVGYLLQRMPVRAILVTQVRVLAALTPPALFLFGAAKLYEFLLRQDLAGRK